ncbi:MAG: zinc-ribbon domain containing protein [Candidatus Dormibacteria bacterium]
MTVDQTLRCRECGVDFIWTEGEQEFFASRGLQNPPSRCPSCRAARRASGPGGGGGGGGYGGGGGGYGGGGGGQRSGGGGARQFFEVPCAGCGQTARVPFQPRGDKPVYCSDCFRAAPR